MRFRVPRAIRGLVTRSSLDREMEDELALRTEDIIRTGVPPPEAARLARLEFGGLDGVKERCRDARGFAYPREVVADVRFALRALRKERALTAAILATLLLGIGTTSATFAVIKAVLIEPLPYADPDRLVMLWNVNAEVGIGVEQARKSGDSVFASDFPEWQHRSGLFEALASLYVEPAPHLYPQPRALPHYGDPDAEPAKTGWVSPDFFKTVGVQPLRGRPFANVIPAGDDPQSGTEVVLQHAYWRQRFAARADVLGRRVWEEGDEGG